MLDYIFYRYYIFYNRRRDSDAVFTAVLIMAVKTLLTILSFVVLIDLIFDIKIDISWLSKFIVLLIILFLMILLFRRYNRNSFRDELIQKYSLENKNKKKVRGYLIIIYLFIISLIPIVTGFLRHNLGLNI